MRKLTLLFCMLCAINVLGANSEQWPTYAGQKNTTRYSPLKQINQQNISKLKQVWVYHTGDKAGKTKGTMPTAFEGTPIFANNKLYLCTPFNNVIALDPASGKMLWHFDARSNKGITSHGASKCRGVAFWQSAQSTTSKKQCQKRIFAGTMEGRIYALDADTGIPCEDFGHQGMLNVAESKLLRGDRYLVVQEGGVTRTTNRHTYNFISPPSVYKNLLITGNSSSDNVLSNMPDGIVWAFDVITGKMVWHFDPIPEQLRDKTGAANSWAPVTVDTKRGLVFVATASPSPDYWGGARKESIPYANAVIALNADSGQVVWHFQTVHHDLWDYDLPCAPVLVELERDGKKIPAVVQTAKTGFTFVFNRETGEPLFPIKETPVPQTTVPGEVTSPTQPIPQLPEHITVTDFKPWGFTFWDAGQCRARAAELDNKGLFTPPSVRGVIHYPSPYGGNNWGGSAFDEHSQYLVVNESNMPLEVKLIPKDKILQFKANNPGWEVNFQYPGPYGMARRLMTSKLGVPCVAPPWGTINAIDLKTGKIAWRKPLGSVKLKGPIHTLSRWGCPNVGGPIITGSGIIFIGATYDSRIHAFNLMDGKLLWQGSLPAPGIATPMTYQVKGKQYIVIATGREAPMGGKIDDALVAYALP